MTCRLFHESVCQAKTTLRSPFSAFVSHKADSIMRQNCSECKWLERLFRQCTETRSEQKIISSVTRNMRQPSDRRKIRLIESNAKCRYLQKFTSKRTFVTVSEGPPLLSFSLGWWRSNYVGSESGQKQSVKLLQNMVSNTTQYPPPPSKPHTVCIYYTLSLGRGEGWGRWTREKVRGAIVYKAGLRIPTWLTVSPVYKLF
jgi:hypothetical protein